jgi:cytoskeletal protein CcmA (bactofilin family)
VEGNILHEALAVEIGAYFEGNCRHSDNPLANAPENVAAIERRPPAPGTPSRPAAASAPAPAPKPAAVG